MISTCTVINTRCNETCSVQEQKSHFLWLKQLNDDFWCRMKIFMTKTLQKMKPYKMQRLLEKIWVMESMIQL